LSLQENWSIPEKLVDSRKVRASTAGWGVVGWNQKYLIFTRNAMVAKASQADGLY
jgi:hypothetical protein